MSWLDVLFMAALGLCVVNIVLLTLLITWIIRYGKGPPR